MEYSLTSPQTLAVIGLVLFIVDAVLFGMATFFLVFLGLASVLTSVLVLSGVIPEDLTYELISIAVLTVVITILLWKPMKNFQSSKVLTNDDHSTSDLVGLEFTIDEETLIQVKYSGVLWALTTECGSKLSAGDKVTVVDAQVARFVVRIKD